MVLDSKIFVITVNLLISFAITIKFLSLDLVLHRHFESFSAVLFKVTSNWVFSVNFSISEGVLNGITQIKKN